MKIIFQEAFVKAFFVLKESVLAFIPFGVGFIFVSLLFNT